MDLNTDFSYMTDEELDELISRIKEARERRSESRKTDLWNNVRRAVNNYIMDFGMIELFYRGPQFYPNRKFFGRTKFFYNQTVDIDNYGSIDEAVRTVIANGLEKEAHGKVIDEKWKKWDEKT